jgi:hypothetical protein
MAPEPKKGPKRGGRGRRCTVGQIKRGGRDWYTYFTVRFDTFNGNLW